MRLLLVMTRLAQISSAQGSSRTNPMHSGRDIDMTLHVAIYRRYPISGSPVTGPQPYSVKNGLR
jgi:hypothetical protein